MPDDQADLVGVTSVPHSQRRLRVANGDDVAVQVGANLVGEIGGILPNDFLDGLLIAAGAGCFENVFEKLLGGGFHDSLSPLSVVLGPWLLRAVLCFSHCSAFKPTMKN